MVGMRTRRSAARQRGQLFEPRDAGFAEALGVGHDVGLADGHEIGRVEEIADRDLMLDGPLAGGPCSPASMAFSSSVRCIVAATDSAGITSSRSAAMAALSTGVMRAISLSTSFCRPAGPRSAPCGAVLPSST